MKKENNSFWDKLQLDKDRVEKLSYLLDEPADLAMKYPKKAVDELTEKLDDFNLREVAFMLVHLSFINDRNRKKSEAVVRLLIDDDNPEVIDNMLNFFNSLDTMYYNDFSEEFEDDE